jgi:autotransporter-associated beta strand protein
VKNPLILTATLLTVSAPLMFAAVPTDTSWISTSSQAWNTDANWSLGQRPGATLGAIFTDSATIQHTLDLGGSSINPTTIGMQFTSFAGGSGFVFNNAGTVQLRGGGTVGGILNSDDNAQTFNVAISMFSVNGSVGSGASMTFNAAAGPLIFTGASSNPTITHNGGRITNTGAFNITIGTTGRGDITGAGGGLVKNGTGTLTLGGTVANSYTGPTMLNAGATIAAKANAFGTGNLILNGGSINSGGFNQTFGTLSLTAESTLDLGSGTSALTFANSSALAWSGTLHILDWTSGSDSIKVGTGLGSLTFTQLAAISWDDLPGISQTVIDNSGFLVPIPEPSTVTLSILGGFGIALALFNRRKKG